MKLFGWHADFTGCYYYRTKWPMAAMKDEGHDVEVGTLSKERHNDRLHVLQRSTNPQAAAKLAAFEAKGWPWVYDLDDAIWALSPDNPGAEHFYRPEVQELIGWLATYSPYVTVSTTPLRDMMIDRFGRTEGNTFVIPNALPKRLTNPNLEPREHTILWRGSPTHDSDVKAAKAALRAADKAGVRIVFAGADYRSKLGLPNAEHLGWVGNTEDYLHAVREVGATVMVIPLALTEFNNAKSQVALLEARAIGAIPICQDTYAYRQWITEGEDGFLCSTNEWAWKSTLMDILSKPYEDYLPLVERGAQINRDASVEAMVKPYSAVYGAAYEALAPA